MVAAIRPIWLFLLLDGSHDCVALGFGNLVERALDRDRHPAVAVGSCFEEALSSRLCECGKEIGLGAEL